MIRFTKITDNTGVLTKTISLGANGELIRTGGGRVYSGKFEVIDLAWSQFGSFLTELNHSECIMPGIARDGLRRGEIRTKAWLEENPAAAANGSTLVRGKEGFCWGSTSKFLVIDFDKIDSSVCSTAAEVLQNFFKIAPAFAAFDYWLLPSSSSYIYNDISGEAISGLRGLHAYFKVAGNLDADLIKEYLSTQLSLSPGGVYFTLQDGWKAGEGRIPVIVKRTAVDTAVFQPFRYWFASGMHCGDGLSQRRGEAQWFAAASTTAVSADFHISEASRREAAAIERSLRDTFAKQINFAGLRVSEIEIAAKRDGVGGKVVKQAWEAAERGIIVGSNTVKLDNGKWEKAWRFLLFPDDWNGATCHDPLEPEYCGGASNKAIIYSAADTGRCSIVSQAHGGRSFKVVLDQHSVSEVLSMFESADEIEDVLGSEWLRLLLFNEGIDDRTRERLLSKVQTAFSVEFATRTQVKELLVATMGEGLEAGSGGTGEGPLLELNAKYATAEIGKAGAFRVLYKVAGESGWYMQRKEDFLSANNVSGGTVRVWQGGTRKLVQAASYWLKAWPGRKHYHSVFFDPALPAGEIEGRGLNIWEGFTVEPTRGRVCGNAPNRSCIRCFVDSGFALDCCSHCKGTAKGIIYWLRHIYECVCREDSEHFIWVLDWLCDVIQRPGGNRPGTALVVHGEQKGTGKEVVIAPLLKLLGGAALQTSKMDNISGKFNAVMESKVLVFADEATWGKGHEVKSALKSLITGETLVVEPKGIDAYSVRNYVRLYAASNREQAYPAEEGERRAAIFNISEHRKGQLKEWFLRFVDQDLSILLDELLHWEIKSNLKLIPNTKSLQAHKELHMAKKIDWVFWNYMVDIDDGLVWDEAGVGQHVCFELLEKYYIDGGFNHFKNEGYATLTWNEFKVRLRLFFEKNDLIGSKAEGPRMNPLLRKKAKHFVLKPISECKKLLAALVG